MFDFTKYDYLVFDCDGVILDSNSLKSKAFNEALPGEPRKLVHAFVDYHQKHGGVSRYEKFHYYFREMKKSPDVEKETRDAIIRFATIVKNGLMKCNYVPGVLEFLKQTNSLGIPSFVVSGSDENELIDVFRQRHILNLFKQVYGSPANKNDNTGKVIERMGQARTGCFFGDSKSDYVASSKYGLDFVFVSEFSEWAKKEDYHSTQTIKNFTYV
jgi:phosphoglycolate phosphatase-like HAD superfamily hydrolase